MRQPQWAPAELAARVLFNPSWVPQTSASSHQGKMDVLLYAIGAHADKFKMRSLSFSCERKKEKKSLRQPRGCVH
eukprot:406569-Pelagomonas_calceolata.AAC.1